MGRGLDEEKDRRRIPADYHAVSTATLKYIPVPAAIGPHYEYMFIFAAVHTRYCVATTFRAAEMIICGHLR